MQVTDRNLFSTLKGINRLDAHEYEKTIQDLLEKIDILECKIKKIAQEKIVAVSSSKIFEDQNELLKEQLTSEKKNNIYLTNANTNYEQEIKNLKENQQISYDKSKYKIDILNKEIKDKENNIKKLNKSISKKNNQIKSISVDNRLNINSSNNYKNNLSKQISQNKKLNEKIIDLEKQIADLNFYKKNEGNLLLELQHLRDDNIRLLKMLNDTEEFKNFSYLLPISTGGVRYIRPIEEKKAPTFKMITSKEERAKSLNDYRKLMENKEKKKEKDLKNWVPIDAYQCITKYFDVYKINMQENVLNEMLLALNKIWQQRTLSEVNHIRNEYQNEIKDLKCKIDNMKTTTKYFDGNKTTTNFKNTSFLTRNTFRDNIITKNSADDKLDAFFRTTANSKNRQNFIESENIFLRQKLQDKNENKPRDNVSDYNKGSLYIAEMCVDEIKNLEKKINDLYKQYENKVKYSIKGNDIIVDDAIKNLIDGINNALGETEKKVNNWKFDIKRNLGGSKYNLKRY